MAREVIAGRVGLQATTWDSKSRGEGIEEDIDNSFDWFYVGIVWVKAKTRLFLLLGVEVLRECGRLVKVERILGKNLKQPRITGTSSQHIFNPERV